MSLYKEEILEHYKEPHNFGALEDADIKPQGNNPVCGDHQEWYIKFSETSEQGSVIEKAQFTGDGCAISIAGASLLSDDIQGKTVEEVLAMDEQAMVELIGTPMSPSRMKCLMLGLTILKRN